MKVTDSAQRFGFLVADIQRLFGRRFEQFAQRTLPMTRAQCRLLAYLSVNRGVSPTVLADILETPVQTLARTLERMEEAGWVRRRPDARDPRIERLFVTRAAVAQLQIARRLSDEVRDEALHGLTAFEAVQLTQLLQKVRRNLTHVVPTPLDTVVPAVLRRAQAGNEASVSEHAAAVDLLDDAGDDLSECTDLRPQ
ncbi:MarR family winged helix-turn-helix transcriptional regulator [Pandoraea commovens]|uniref:MarR family transcriptional regulator n=1 Tax=Pandoraea commovens TaxID=2508289 RepID=A0A5E4WKD2_9BURK|nr:MarR family winged helix-turn-helix transcriptional regulator [Pandoraea commovens]UVA80712.1 MarR family winged helix-turn-helix transcriptional regulator [Pandoraea commovens]VVE24329.1 MarR family transcriptional regulator [Pandoraea commovens]